MKAIKENIINDLIEKLNASPFMIVIDYKALTVAQLGELRSRLSETNSTAHVTKNSYAKRASVEAEYPEGINESLAGQTALVTGDQDICAVAKVLKDFKKENEKPEMRAGVMDGNLLSPEELNALASLPPMDVLRAHLLGTLQSPASTFVRLLNEPASSLARILKAKEEQG
ncbi:MAG: 50S ribosomal protein L10 [Akkermansiaceae bacterium]|jgi:large subunit ribosomal protein L10|nr:50S ribosomal protein L10 [Akkermansiaceae bacterium]MDG1852732.1 50S ribosomal protein L10 [Verrucomicrobiales bacterium]